MDRFFSNQHPIYLKKKKKKRLIKCTSELQQGLNEIIHVNYLELKDKSKEKKKTLKI